MVDVFGTVQRHQWVHLTKPWQGHITNSYTEVYICHWEAQINKHLYQWVLFLYLSCHVPFDFWSHTHPGTPTCASNRTGTSQVSKPLRLLMHLMLLVLKQRYCNSPYLILSVWIMLLFHQHRVEPKEAKVFSENVPFCSVVKPGQEQAMAAPYGGSAAHLVYPPTVLGVK